MEFNSCEYTVSQRSEGKWLLAKILLIAGYLVYTAAYLVIIINTGFVPLGALIPVTLWIIVFFTWRFACPDYKYSIDSGFLTYTVIYGGKTKQEKFRMHIADAKAIAPIEQFSEKSGAARTQKFFSAIPQRYAKDIYGMMFEMNGKVCIFKFKVTRETLKALKYYNSNTVVTNTEF